MEIRDGETREESRRRYSSVDDDIRIERMMTEIGNGGTKANSLVVNGPEDERLWDALAEQMAEITARGGFIDYGLRDPD